MNSVTKEVSYQNTSTYSILNELTPKTKNVWVVFHGIGYLSRYFLKYFKELDPQENYILVPQAPSKYYLNNKYTHVGASWLTRENTATETENIFNYLDRIYLNEGLKNAPNLIILGYSQGVSIATRWVAKRKIKCARLILCSGGIPTELRYQDFEFLTEETKFSFFYGTRDPYLEEKKLKEEKTRAQDLFGKKRLEIIPFEGGHEMLNAKKLGSG